uniref:Thymus, brain and testes associated n=1 Tax=Monopterus albus TaxID=43700 RepID=A0A3Q3Q0W0_MONAL
MPKCSHLLFIKWPLEAGSTRQPDPRDSHAKILNFTAEKKPIFTAWHQNPHSPDPQQITGETSHSQTNRQPFNTEFAKMLTKSSPRFGTLSHHSFFSRHNPHPHRVRHIQGLNGRPVCMVRDDWFVTSSLFPHPLLNSHTHRRNLFGMSSNKNKSALLSKAWRDELKELAAKVNLSSETQKDKKEEEFVRRKTQYSAVTGRIIPPSTKSYQCRSHSQRLAYPHPFHDQELMVLELLCQILQTDSLSTVQQWLLLAGQRGKMLHATLIVQLYVAVDLYATVITLYQIYLSVFDNLFKVKCSFAERIGDAEVLEVHTGAQNDYSLQNAESL